MATVAITRSSGSGSAGSVTDNNDGTYTATVTAPTAVGSGVFVATLNGQPVKNGGASQTQATVTYVHGTATGIEVTPASDTINVGDTETYSATASDGYGNTWDVTADTTFSIDSDGRGQLGHRPVRQRVYLSELRRVDGHRHLWRGRGWTTPA